MTLGIKSEMTVKCFQRLLKNMRLLFQPTVSCISYVVRQNAICTDNLKD